MDNTEENKYSFWVGVSGDSRISADTVKFSGWTFWASESEHRVASYTSLAQIGIDTAALSETDFFNNIQTIINKMPAYSDLSFYCNVGANFTKSLNLQLIHDGISGALENMEGILRLERRGHINWGTMLVYQRNGGDLMVRGLYDVNGSSAVLYPFKVIATTEALNIKTYTALEQLNLSDADMAEDDFVGNLDKINNAYYNAFQLQLYCDGSNNAKFRTSLLKALEENNLIFNTEKTGFTVKMERTTGPWQAIKIELIVDDYVLSNGISPRTRTIIGYANVDVGVMYFLGFREVAKIQPVVDITPLNGWSFKLFKVGRVGNSTIFNLATLDGGVRTTGTVIGILPEIYRPVVNCAFAATSNSSTAGLSRIAVLTDGQIKVYGLDDSTGEVTCSGSLITK